jgi:indolepyruvate ferredoxin oxidoreductase
MVPRRTGTRAAPESGAVAELPPPVTTVDPADFTMRITGIGGTGVVTIAQVLATAAAIEGRYVRALDQTGLAQKGGAVVSDLMISDHPQPRSPKSPTAAAIFTWAATRSWQPSRPTSASPPRTAPVAVMSSAQAPTGEMVIDPGGTRFRPHPGYSRSARAG